MINDNYKWRITFNRWFLYSTLLLFFNIFIVGCGHNPEEKAKDLKEESINQETNSESSPKENTTSETVTSVKLDKEFINFIRNRISNKVNDLNGNTIEDIKQFNEKGELILEGNNFIGVYHQPLLSSKKYFLFGEEIVRNMDVKEYNYFKLKQQSASEKEWNDYWSDFSKNFPFLLNNKFNGVSWGKFQVCGLRGAFYFKDNPTDVFYLVDAYTKKAEMSTKALLGKESGKIDCPECRGEGHMYNSKTKAKMQCNTCFGLKQIMNVEERMQFYQLLISYSEIEDRNELNYFINLDSPYGLYYKNNGYDVSLHMGEGGYDDDVKLTTLIKECLNEMLFTTSINVEENNIQKSAPDSNLQNLRNDKELYRINDPDGYSNLRKSPNGEIIRKVFENETFEIIDEKENYKLVKFPDNSTGYIHNSRVKRI